MLLESGVALLGRQKETITYSGVLVGSGFEGDSAGWAVSQLSWS